MTCFLMYNDSGRETGELLGELLSINHGHAPSKSHDYVIRWGNRNIITHKVRGKVYNKRDALTNCINKLKSLEIMKEACIPLPSFNTDPIKIRTPMLGRTLTHSEGKDIILILQLKDLKFKSKSDFYVELISKKREFRVHVIGGKVAFVSEKLYDGRKDRYSAICWNNLHRWQFKDLELSKVDKKVKKMSIRAVKCLELDFGAVDIIVSDKDKVYVLEVNTCPALNEEHREIYRRELTALVKAHAKREKTLIVRLYRAIHNKIIQKVKFQMGASQTGD